MLFCVQQVSCDRVKYRMTELHYSSILFSEIQQKPLFNLILVHAISTAVRDVYLV